MAVSGLVKGLAWQESVVDGQLNNVGQIFFLLILVHISSTAL